MSFRFSLLGNHGKVWILMSLFLMLRVNWQPSNSKFNWKNRRLRKRLKRMVKTSMYRKIRKRIKRLQKALLRLISPLFKSTTMRTVVKLQRLRAPSKLTIAPPKSPRRMYSKISSKICRPKKTTQIKLIRPQLLKSKRSRKLQSHLLKTICRSSRRWQPRVVPLLKLK